MENEVLQQILNKLDSLERGQAELRAEQTQMRTEQTQMRTELNARFDKIEYSLDNAWKDIDISLTRTESHVREFHSSGIK